MRRNTTMPRNHTLHLQHIFPGRCVNWTLISYARGRKGSRTCHQFRDEGNDRGKWRGRGSSSRWRRQDPSRAQVCAARPLSDANGDVARGSLNEGCSSEVLNAPWKNNLYAKVRKRNLRLFQTLVSVFSFLRILHPFANHVYGDYEFGRWEPCPTQRGVPSPQGRGIQAWFPLWSLQAGSGIRGACVCDTEQGETQSRRGKVGEEGGKEKGMEHRRIIYRKRPAPSWTRRP